MAVFVLSCKETNPDPVPVTPDPAPVNPEPALVHHVLDASMSGEEKPEGTKAALNPSDDSEILWKAGEEVTVFVGDTPYTFTGDNATPVATARFEGEAPADLGTYVMLYPKNTSATKSGTTITTSLSADQTGFAGSYAEGTIILAGTSSTASVTCKHVCSGVRFKTGRPGVSKVTLKGNNGEKIAGDFSFSFSEGTPVAGSGTEDTITLTAPDDGTFEADKWYYIVSLPCVFSNGITMTAYAGSQVGTLVISTKDLTFSRSVMKQVASLDSRMTWNTAIYYGPQNSFCATVDTPVGIDITPRFIDGNWQRGHSDAPSAMPYSADVLWGKATAGLSGRILTMSGPSEGSSLVAIKDKSGNILWSYLLWVKSSFGENTLPSGAVMQEELGGGGLKFQWGRKDPLQDDCDEVGNQGDNGLAYSIANPTKFINGVSPTKNWYTGSDGRGDDNLWGGISGQKTVWDPCPQGWRVPTNAAFAGLSKKSVSYGFADGYYYSATPIIDPEVNSWADGLAVEYFPYYSSYEYEIDGSYRETAHSVRCVKE